MHTPFLVSIKCPECGGPLRYPEGAYTFQCPYCSSILRIKKEGVVLKYLIPPRMLSNHEIRLIIRKAQNEKKVHFQGSPAIHQIKTVYKPFWYFKGMLYYNYVTGQGNDTLAKTWYYSFQANPDYAGSLHTLSVRAEVLTLEPYDNEALKGRGTIIPLTLTKEDAVRFAESSADMNLQYEAGHSIYKKLYLIGEHIFIIYYPIIQVVCARPGGYHTFMFDGVAKGLLEEKAGQDALTAQSTNGEEPYRIRLLTHRCKNCGYDLAAREFDIFFYCNTCGRLWLLKEGEYYSTDIKVLAGPKEENSVYLPFWRFEVEIKSEAADIELKTIGDLSTFMKMGRFMLRNEDPKRPIRLYVPALVTRNARALLKLASKINLHQKALPVSENGRFPYTKILNASLPQHEAEEMLDVIIFSIIGRRDKTALKFYQDASFHVTRKELIWYPFEDRGNFYFDPFHQFTFPKKSMDINVYG